MVKYYVTQRNEQEEAAISRRSADGYLTLIPRFNPQLKGRQEATGFPRGEVSFALLKTN
jgi:hypothetical protein